MVVKSTDGMGRLVRPHLGLTHNAEVKCSPHTGADTPRIPFSSKDVIRFAEKRGDGHPSLTFGE